MSFGETLCEVMHCRFKPVVGIKKYEIKLIGFGKKEWKGLINVSCNQAYIV